MKVLYGFLKLKNGVCDWLQSVLLHDGRAVIGFPLF